LTIEILALRLKYKDPSKEEVMEFKILNNEAGKIGWMILWLLGIPIPVLIILFVLRGCT
jgi:hypothetical protein